MDWAKILAPLSGGESDKRVLRGRRRDRRAVRRGAGGRVRAGRRRRPDPMDGRRLHGRSAGHGPGKHPTRLRRGRTGRARQLWRPAPYRTQAFISLKSPVWAALAMEGRLADVLVFDDSAGARSRAAGRGVPADRRRRAAADHRGPPGPEARRRRRRGLGRRQGGQPGDAHRPAAAAEGVEGGRSCRAPGASSRKFEVASLQAFLAARGVAAEAQVPEGYRRSGAGADPRGPGRRRPTSWWPALSATRGCRSSSSAARPKGFLQRRGSFAVPVALTIGFDPEQTNDIVAYRNAARPQPRHRIRRRRRSSRLFPDRAADGGRAHRRGSYARHKDACAVRRFAPDEDPTEGRLARRGTRWFFDYDDGGAGDDEPVFRLGDHRFAVGEYVTVTDEDGRPLTYKVVDVASV